MNMDSKNLNYSIGIVTYVNRYHAFLRPAIRALVDNFPDKQIVCIINGHPDKTKHLAYLKEITRYLSEFPNIQYITWDDHQSLAKCWNWTVLMSTAKNVLILNDDTLVKPGFREDFEKQLATGSDFFAVNGSFSHFLVSKKLIKLVGWFDERYLGVGFEDADYLIRIAQKNVPLDILNSSRIKNIVALNPDAGFKNISTSKIVSKYADINQEFMQQKWIFNHLDGEDNSFDLEFSWKGISYKSKLRDGMQTPEFYDQSLLADQPIDFAPKRVARVNIGLYKRLTNKLRLILRNIKVK